MPSRSAARAYMMVTHSPNIAVVCNAEQRARAALYHQFAELFESYDLVVTPGANTPACDVDLRHPEAIGGVKHYMAASLVTAAVTLSASPALSLPCGFDQYGRPVGFQLVGRPRGEMETGLASRVPIDPRAGEVPPEQTTNLRISAGI